MTTPTQLETRIKNLARSARSAAVKAEDFVLRGDYKNAQIFINESLDFSRQCKQYLAELNSQQSK